MPARALFLLILLPLMAVADGAALDREMQLLEQGQDLAAMQARIQRADEKELATAEGFVWRVRLAALTDQAEQAKQLLNEGLAAHPESSQLALQRSGLLSASVGETGNFGRMRLAREIRDSLLRAVELDPESIPARLGLIMFYLNAPRLVGGGADRAEPHLDFVQARSPMDYFDVQGAAAMGRGEMAIAVDWFQRATEADPDRRPRFQQALALASLEQHDAARTLLQTILESFPQHSGAWYQLGRISVLDESELEAGLAALQRFLELPVWPMNPSTAAAWWRIGQLHQLRGDVDPARAAFRQALAENPEFEPASEALSALDG
ncbi:MAG: tetratricopeptide repeat protein [Wenzhouxiangella sp.]